MTNATRKVHIKFTHAQKLEYKKLMVEKKLF